ADTYIARDVLNWDQGLRRLALGAFMPTDRGGEARTFTLGGDAYVPEEIGASSLSNAARFSVLVRSLVSDAKWMREGRYSLSQWAGILVAALETYLIPRADLEERQLAECRRALEELALLDMGEGRAVSYRVARDLALARLGQHAKGRSGKGVVVS